MRAAWRGYISIGQIGIPIRLYSAARSVRQDFVLLHEADGSPVERVLKCAAEDLEIDYAETVRAIEHEPGKYITFTPRELAGTADEQSRSIAVKQFFDPNEIPSIYFERPFYIVPAMGGERAYGLLRETLHRSGKAAIGQFVIYNKQHIGAISTYGDLLILYQLRFEAELLPRSQIKTPAIPKASPSEIDALSELVERFSGPLHIGDFHDEQVERIDELVARKAKGLPAPRSRSVSLKSSSDEDLLPIIRSTLDEAGQTVSGSAIAKQKPRQKGEKRDASAARSKRSR